MEKIQSKKTDAEVIIKNGTFKFQIYSQIGKDSEQKNDAEVIIKNGTFEFQLNSQIRNVSRWKIVLQMRVIAKSKAK